MRKWDALVKKTLQTTKIQFKSAVVSKSVILQRRVDMENVKIK